MTKTLRVSIEGFAHELQSDLKRLIEQYPNGIYFANLSDEYGESIARITKACNILVERGVIQVQKAASNAYYIIPKDYIAAVPLIELTDLQRKLALFLYLQARKAQNRLLSTNYSQLTKLMECSYGGLVTAVNRLVALDYLEIRQQSEVGQRIPLLLYITDKLVVGLTNNPPTF